MMLLGHVGVGAVHVLGDRTDLVLGEAPERLGDELEVVGEVGRAGAVLRALLAERLEERGRAVLRRRTAAPARVRSGRRPTPSRVRACGSRRRRPRRRRTRGRASTRSRRARRTSHMTFEPSTAAAAWARSYASDLVLVELGDGDLAALGGRGRRACAAALFDDAGDRVGGGAGRAERVGHGRRLGAGLCRRSRVESTCATDSAAGRGLRRRRLRGGWLRRRRGCVGAGASVAGGASSPEPDGALVVACPALVAVVPASPARRRGRAVVRRAVVVVTAGRRRRSRRLPRACRRSARDGSACVADAASAGRAA